MTMGRGRGRVKENRPLLKEMGRGGREKRGRNGTEEIGRRCREVERRLL